MSDPLIDQQIDLDRTKQKLEMLKRGYDELAQQYHLLGHIIDRERHINKNWKGCGEQSCKLVKNTLKIIGVE